MKKLAVAVLMLGFAAGAYASAEDKYNRACVACHSTGAANAPKTHDVAAWEPRLAKGMDAMPPRGMCMDCTPEDYTAIIEFMSKPAP